MTRGNSLGGISLGPAPPQRAPKVSTTEVVVKVNDSHVDKIRHKGSAILCCCVTTTLVAVGVGISIWYAVSEI